MANLRICYLNRVDDAATVDSGTSEASGYERDYLMAPWRSPSYTWRSTSTAAQHLQFDLGATRSISCAALFNHNLTSSGTIRVQGDNNSSYGSPAKNTTYDALASVWDWDEAGDEPQFFLAWFNTVTTCRYWRLTLTDASNPDGYLSAGRVFFGTYWTPATNMSYGYTLSWTDPSRLVRGPGGLVTCHQRAMHRSVNLNLRGLTDAENAEVLDIQRATGKSTDLIVSGYPGDSSARERQNTVLGHASQWNANTHAYYNLNTVGLKLVEAV